ncbi:unnamed protein product, partial [Oppiella nova]
DLLLNEGNDFVLKIPFVDHIFDNSVIDDVTVKVILPEGSSDINYRSAYTVDRQKDQKHYTYLDTIGRTVLVFHKSNVVEEHIQDVEVHYKFNKILLLQEPLLVVGAIFSLCILVVIYVRLDFSISKNPQKQSSAKINAINDSIIGHHDRRATVYEQLDKASNKFKTTKDLAAFQAIQKRLNAEHKTETQAITDLQARLKQEGASSESLERVNELQRLDRSLKEQISQQMLLVEKLVNGKVAKAAYLESDAQITKKKEESVHKILVLIKNL